jgi:hypothetical protein
MAATGTSARRSVTRLVSRAALAALAAGLVAACAPGHPPGPPHAANVTSNYNEVPYPPPPARIELIPARPDDHALWTDGEWRYRGRRWRWVRGSWSDVPPGAKFAHWASTIRADGAFLYAPGQWFDASGKAMPAPKSLVRGVSNALALDDDPGLKEESVVQGPDVPPNLKAGIGSGGGAPPSGQGSTNQQSTNVGAAK